ncbi:MAG: anthranilate phosphoribosyltransferase [Acidimicrobiia bacterium]|nr:anthranilate phosphoribosyltransferase [Acidimicrobiia bacterium]
MRDLLDLILDRHDLTADQATELMIGFTSGDQEPPLLGALLAGLRAKGETAEEVRGLARGMRQLARKPNLDAKGAVDVVGTGGDGSGSLNLSTGAAIVAAAAGVPIVKHGNRSMSSLSGSADLLEALGLPMPMDETQAAECFDNLGFTFLFAPYFHPAMGAVVPIRKSLGVRTVFNLLGPLTNPGSPDFAVIGAWSLDAARLMAGALAGSGIERAFVCHGSNGWDEPTPVGPFHLFDVRGREVTESVRDPSRLGIESCSESALAGGTPQENARDLVGVLEGKPGSHRDAIALGAALALEVAGLEESPDDSLDRAYAAIDDGSATRLVASFASVNSGSA